MTLNKKKYKFYWSLFNLGSDTPAVVTKLQMIFASLSAIITSSTWYVSDASNAIWIGVIGIIIDKLVLGGLNVEEME